MRALSYVSSSLVLFLAGCGDASKPAAAPGADANTRFPLNIGASTLKTRVALTELELSTGLMTTRALPKDEGMIFVYRDGQQRSFWMKNVPYDIDIGFFDGEGKLDEVTRLKAESLDVIDSKSHEIRYAMEAPPGWYADRGLRPGAKLDLVALARAIRERGFPEKEFVDAR